MHTDELDFDQIARELLIALRGRRSQTAWSRRLGYRSNVAYAWESGRRWPTAAELLRAAGRGGLDLPAALTRFYGHAPPWLDTVAVDSPEAVARLLDDLRGNTPINDLAATSGISRYSISRWLSGHTQPRLPDFLRLVEAASVRLIDLLAVLAAPAAMPSVAPIWKRLEARRQGADRLPWTQAILRALELADYLALPAHEPGWIARRLGISEEEETRCLSFLRDTGQIHWQGVRYRIQKLAVDTNRNPAVNRRLKAHWARVGAQRAEEGAPGQFSYNVFSVSRADFERIREAHLRYFYAMRAIVAESQPDEVVAVVNVQLFALGEPE
jgi:transcriptional regulator with XRE-family HTH domain